MEKRPHLIPSIVSILMLIACLGQWPYGYYTLLRFVVCGSAVYIAVVSYEWKQIWACWVFGIIAFLFNPLIPIHLDRDLWMGIDLLCAVFFAVSLIMKTPPPKSIGEAEK